MAENYKGRERRYFFSRGQMVMLGGAFTLASILIFCLGIYVGKGLEQQKLTKGDDSLVRVPVGPVTSGAAGVSSKPEEKITFYETLTNPLKAESSSADNKKQAKAAEPAAAKEAEKTPDKVKEKTDGPKAAKKAEPEKKDDANDAEEKSETNAWTVQVNAFPDERSAQIWVDRLKKKGYKAYITEITNRGKTWYRVRVGRYSTRQEAEAAEDVLKSKENFVKAFATSR